MRIRVPATSANLGPGFDSFGLALGIFDEVEARLTDVPDSVEISGEGAGELPRDGSHLIVSVARRTMLDLGFEHVGLQLTCVNRIPQSRGLGSSAAAIVAGVLIGKALAGGDLEDLADTVRRATVFEGHPDNVAPAVLGGFTTAWMDEGQGRAISSPPAENLAALAIVPSAELSTAQARGALPAVVPFGDAVFNVSRAGLLVHAVTARPDLLLEATGDRLHQEYRRSVYPVSMRIVDGMRAAGHAAFISGAGPTVLILTTAERLHIAAREAYSLAAQADASALVEAVDIVGGATII